MTPYLQTGEYSNGTACLPCPLGYYCESAISGPVICADGRYADEEGLVLCKACPAGKSCTQKDTAVDCEPGYYSLLGDMPCYVSRLDAGMY